MSKRILIAVFAISLFAPSAAWAAPGSQGPARPTTNAKAFCPSGQNVIYVSQDGVTEPDVGLTGNTWAGDSYQRIITVVRVWGNTYCAATRYVGSFSSMAGVSPSGLAFVGDGDTGSFYGGYRTTLFTAKWRPSAPTSGTIGPVVDWVPLYFSDVQGYDLAWWTFSYYTTDHGYWANKADYSYGDIVG
jgi:hypothetical protein